jgi:prepilin peptidase CpaA
VELSGLALGITLGIASLTDWQQRKIYNKLIGPAFLFAFCLQAMEKGWPGVWLCLAGGGAGLALLIIPYLMGGIGAGDVKLLGVIGAFGGVNFVGTCFLYGALLGGIVSLFILIRRKALSAVFKNLLFHLPIKHFIPLLPQSIYPKPLSDAQKAACEEKFPYGIVLVAGAVFACLLPLGWC